MTALWRLGAVATPGGRAAAERLVARLPGSWCFAWVAPRDVACPDARRACLIEALAEDRVDVVVVPLEDVPAPAPAAVHVACVPRRSVSEEAWFVRADASDTAVTTARRVATDHAWRAALLHEHLAADAVVVLERDASAALRSVAAGEVDAALLASEAAAAVAWPVRALLAGDAYLPRAGQGVEALLVRRADARAAAAVDACGDVETAAAVTAERAVLERLGLSPAAPVGARAMLAGGVLRLRAGWERAEGEVRHTTVEGPLTAAAALGIRAAEALLAS